jgi:hypothetical protein
MAKIMPIASRRHATGLTLFLMTHRQSPSSSGLLFTLPSSSAAQPSPAQIADTAPCGALSGKPAEAPTQAP